ncbi:type III secretion apparatus protein OrgA/MxiK [Serratia proteamaculans]|uniref:type III secretion apparatus protein OrgA/MxiK n=1 Tax=Serratia proteamaculans TaxID=28151 RepID=UPI0010766771|nr:type III secretion apparatus protein OrgA/MxiK [Serratia proteamaculans]TFZ48660.1 type III secretion apparatus protein OrgA/MxiK [Serratia proteamaculans]
MSRHSLSCSLQRVLFDPLLYLHPQRVQIPEDLASCSAERAAVNELLLGAFRLEAGHIDLSPLARQWVRHWHRLPQVAYLIGCHSLRAELAWKGGLLNLPSWAITFTAIDLPTKVSLNQSANIQSVPGHEALMATGYARLRLWRSQLPEPLRQRFPLLFAPYVDSAAPQPAADSLILTLALQHAEKYPNSPP